MPAPSEPTRLVTIFGGSGFVGRHIVRHFAKRGWRIRVAVRRPDLAGFLQPLGTVGQIRAVQANLRYPWSVEQALEGADAAVNCVGILVQSGNQSFDAIQASGPRTISEAAKKAGIKDVVHISAIGADAASQIPYFRSKAEGEAGIFEHAPEAVVLRPSIVFGPEDDFFNRFAGMAGLSPVLPVIGGGTTRFQPVWVGDVAEAVARALEGKAQRGAVYELGGPEVLTFRECMELMLRTINRRRKIVSIPTGFAKAMSNFTKFLPNAPLTPDQVRQLELDNVVSDEAKAEGRTLDGLGIEPSALELILPTYLVRFRSHGQFTARYQG
ncbi:complex I NDUFA9 subunit family protein [Afifella sp. IM 167]|uniref:complex I NDUFA9 subunit family protein n=1 Tax=Afifella sp. IM 167 TaxID=2033586 RepID=UPI001CCB5DBB|nr:complex I NDUFA9 subunit family protein [Afifella sp. IM 167]